eukprot:TRINITY_DN1325_c0_g1_i1.p1 TRINITY_DN1325_c0_g1~~TRINITY_DN1325_c0_g1_i1.p1  ORF type:complete len:1053 (-),score=115.39 TRINITY_DN1325_c0_g1_i1:161-3319(-)
MLSARTPLFLLLALAAGVSSSTPYTSYGVMIQAGSAKSSVAVYKWPTRTNKNTFPVLAVEPVAQSSSLATVGIHTFAGKTSGIANYLDPLIAFAKDAVPLDDQRITSVLLFAGGPAIRALTQAQQAAILSATRIYLNSTANQPFKSSNDWTRILSEEEEASYAWLTTNLATYSLSENGDIDGLAGILLLEGNNALVGFAPEIGPSTSNFDLRLPQPHFYRLYAKAYSGLGTDTLHLKYLLGLATEGTHSGLSDDPVPCACCFYQDAFNISLPVSSNRNQTFWFSGTGQVPDCVASVRTLFVAQAPTSCYLSPCTLAGQYQPPVPATTPFVAVGAISALADFFGCLGDGRTAGCLLPSVDPCATYFDIAKENHPNSSLEFLHHVCFHRTVAHLYLTEVVGLDPGHTTTFYNESSDWSLGALTAAVGSWAVPCDAPAPVADPAPEIDFGVVIVDVGSETRVNIYQYHRLTDGSVPDVTSASPVQSTWAYRKSPGLAALESTPSLVGTYLYDLVMYASEQVPLNQRAVTPIALRAGSGLRQLSASSAAAILEAARTYLASSSNSPFVFDTEKGVSLLSQQEEIAYGWVTVNSLLGTWTSTLTTAVLSLDTSYFASAAFTPVEPPNSAHFDLWLRDAHYGLLAQSSISLSVDRMDQQYLALLSQGLGVDNSVTSVPNACFFTGYTYSGTYDNGHNFTFPGSSNFQTCSTSVRKLLNLTSSAVAPAIPSATGVYAIGYFAEVAAFFNCSGIRAVSCVYNSAKTFCSRNWASAQLAYPNLLTSVLNRRCFSAAYVDALLRDWLGFTDTRTVTFASAINSTDLNWGLGAFTADAGMWDVQPSQCFLTYEPPGIPDDSSLLTSAWLSAEPKSIVVGTMAQVRLRGVRVIAEASTLRVKLSSRFQDCLGTAPGSAENGFPVSEGGLAFIGNVSTPGDYRLCFQHRLNWEPSTSIITVQSRAEAQEGLYFGTQSCAAALGLDPGMYCGCFFAQLSEDRYAPYPEAINSPLDMPAVLVAAANPQATEPWIVEQGCCTSDTVRFEYELGNNAVWGVCNFVPARQ